MRTLSITLACLFIFAGAGIAQDKKTDSKLVATVSIKVESIQCRMCVKTVEKALKKAEGVESAKVDRDTKVATVTYAPAKTTLAQLEEVIAKSGYDANDKKADPEAYEKLDECCKVSEEQ